MQSIWEENRKALPALAAAATLGGLRVTVAGPGAAYATARAGAGLPAFAHAAPTTSSGSAASGRTLRNTALLRGGGGGGGVVGGTITEDDTDTAKGDDTRVGVDADSAYNAGVIHLPLVPGTHNVSIEAPGTQPEVRVVEVPADGSGARVRIKLTAAPQMAAAQGQEVEQRPGHTAGLGGSFPYRVLRGRGATTIQDDVHAGTMDPAVQGGDSMSAKQENVATGVVDVGDEDSIDVGAADDAHAADHVAIVDLSRVEMPASAGDLADWAAGLVDDQEDGDVHERIGGALVSDGGGGADVGHEEQQGQGVDGGPDSGIGAAVMAVVPDPPHSPWWRTLRGAIAAAGAAFLAVQMMRLTGRPVLGAFGRGESGARGPRGGRRGVPAVAHGHHSFHMRPPGIV